ncbi:deoxyribodipyrimidine photo-lyase [Marinobacter orientalis]|uniref:Deoxyribodipyrimidine photo-lyase n=1 Tax=Marinobacter orientalis TaxID=1928859 RepID=A0A7Y0RD79_9GAMM|nr:deoxyribodipyrimidine photo-lyase [Marinobacter orientalis]NMT64111.1 deoxyribodipyrimidine photo-lyase [Marinobacter orientalis]TGX49340.1 deoxyribodipyrimidine photo-lyase [Marinobacter orientalis]
MTQLVWFRNDLRVADNAALTAACKQQQPVRACFIVTPQQWRAHDWSPARVRFVLDHANALSEELAGLGIALSFITATTFTDSIEKLKDFCRRESIRHVHFNEEYGVNERRRDKTLKQSFDTDGIAVNKYRDQTVAPVGSILTQQEEPYSVFTPFSRRWRSWIDAAQPTLLPVPEPVGDVVAAASYDEPPEGFDSPPPPLVKTGEDAAHHQLQAFLDNRAGDYRNLRDLPSVDGTSLLSPYLANGVLSGRQCLIAARQHQGMGGNQEGLATWTNEIAWRDFYINILYHYPRVSMHRAFKPETEALQWNTPGENFEAWKTGNTGIPIVDAAMRQLNRTGWMHNRLRMITAMFLTKNLFIDWRLGEAYFMSKLVDGFLASNNGGWQWSASTGTDSAPYFRVFNPATQSQRFDPDGEFIREYVHELAKLDNKRIHQPWAGGVIPGGYPRPIVDLKESRKEAISKFQALKS